MWVAKETASFLGKLLYLALDKSAIRSPVAWAEAQLKPRGDLKEQRGSWVSDSLLVPNLLVAGGVPLCVVPSEHTRRGGDGFNYVVWARIFRKEPFGTYPVNNDFRKQKSLAFFSPGTFQYVCNYLVILSSFLFNMPFSTSHHCFPFSFTCNFMMYVDTFVWLCCINCFFPL